MSPSRKRDLTGIAKSIEPGQPVQSVQADQGRTFRYLQIFRVFIDNSTLLDCHFEIIEPYWPVLSSFPVSFI